MCPTINRTSFRRHAATMDSASAALMAIGFSTMTCFPASAAAIVSRQCATFADTMKIASTSGCRTISSTLVKPCGTPAAEALARAVSADLFCSATSCAVLTFLIAGAIARAAKPPYPAIPNLTGWFMTGPR